MYTVLFFKSGATLKVTYSPLKLHTLQLSLKQINKILGQIEGYLFFWPFCSEKKYVITPDIRITPASNLGYLATPPGQFFMGAKLFIGTPWMGNEGVLKKILVWAM